MHSYPPFPRPVHGKLLLEKSSGFPKARELTIALAVNSDEYPEQFTWAENNGFALEYTPDPLKPELVSPQITPYLRENVPVRFHCRFGQHELGNEDRAQAIHALTVHQRIFDAIAALGEPFVTVHLNLNKRIPFSVERGIENLEKLVEYGRQLGLTVCLENLKKGPASDPVNILKWARNTGAGITLDIGHAVSSDIVNDGGQTVTGFVDLFQERLAEVHMYGKEEDRHYPITEISSYGPVIDRLLETDCSWWTIELGIAEEALGTRMQIIDYLTTRHKITTDRR